MEQEEESVAESVERVSRPFRYVFNNLCSGSDDERQRFRRLEALRLRPPDLLPRLADLRAGIL